MACSWTCAEISKPLPSGWTANLDGQTCYHSAKLFFMIRSRAPVEHEKEKRLCAGIRRDAMKERVSVVVVVRLDSAECATTNSRKS